MFQKSDTYILGAAGLSCAMSIALWFSGDRDAGLFVGIWVPSILSVGNYVKSTIASQPAQRKQEVVR